MVHPGCTENFPPLEPFTPPLCPIEFERDAARLKTLPRFQKRTEHNPRVRQLCLPAFEIGGLAHLPLQGSAGNAFGRGSSKDRFRSSRQLRHPVRINVSPISIWAMDSLLRLTRSDAPLDLPRSKLSTAYRGAKTCWQFPRHRQRHSMTSFTRSILICGHLPHRIEEAAQIDQGLGAYRRAATCPCRSSVALQGGGAP